LLGVGFLGHQDRSESFLLADRTLGTLELFASTFSTFYGTGIVFTFAAFAYLHGVGAFALPLAAVAGFLPLALVAPRIKALSDQRRAITLPGLMADFWTERTRTLAALVTGGLFAAALVVDALAALTRFRVEVGHLEGPLQFCERCSPGGLATYWTRDLEEHLVQEVTE